VKKVGSFTIAVIILAFVLLVLGVIGCLNKAHTDNTKWLQNSWNEVMNEQRHLLEMIRENQNQIARLLGKLEEKDNERKD
jgi:predicted PurR-regulated permease PerM